MGPAMQWANKDHNIKDIMLLNKTSSREARETLRFESQKTLV